VGSASFYATRTAFIGCSSLLDGGASSNTRSHTNGNERSDAYSKKGSHADTNERSIACSNK
jgi:hypothetical protein